MRKLAKAVNRVCRGGEKGFTLIELLVVIGILAALAGVVTLAVSQFIGRGACQACLTERHNVQTAVVAYMADNEGDVPTAVADLMGVSGYLLDSPKYADDWDWDGSTGRMTVDCTTIVESDCTSPQ